MLKTFAAFALGVILAPKVHDALNLMVPIVGRKAGVYVGKLLFPEPMDGPIYTYTRHIRPQEETSTCSSS